ncbi:MAG: ATP-binding protein [Acidiferrobacteraceae bacterium]
MTPAPKPAESEDIAKVGQAVDEIDVNIGPRFLNLFSEHLYSSPNKAFEELVSNSWDAGAEAVYIGVPDDLTAPNAAIWVLDNGQSMDVNGFRALWSVATSKKRQAATLNGRKQIGKFGVGKLATYILANQLTHICKATDSKIRAITMDFRAIDEAAASSALHIEKMPLAVRELSDADLEQILTKSLPGRAALELIEAGIPKLNSATDYDNEFGGLDSVPPKSTGTWTLAILSALKGDGRSLQQGWIKRILRSALPLGTTISVKFNEDVLYSSKSSATVQQEWILGPELGIDTLEIGNRSVPVIAKDTPYPCLEIEGLGAVSGRVRIFKSRISGGKSDQVDASNGFFVNVRGRVIKPEDPYFGIDNLNHSAWAKFRATIRADGLDERISVNRESIADSAELQIIRALLKKLFNKARSVHDAAEEAGWPDAGAILTEKWGTVPFEPLLRVVGERLHGTLPAFVDTSNVKDMAETQREWQTILPKDVIRGVILKEGAKDDRLVTYDLASHSVIVNKSHPFASEHGTTQEQLRLLRDTAFVELLTEAFMADIGIPDDRIKEIADYRERAYRLVAQVRRCSAPQIAAMLVEATNHEKGFERIIGDALEHIGFAVERLGQSGQPEGIATANITAASSGNKDIRQAYKFTYDAKSSAKGKASTHNVGFSALARHRVDAGADHALVVAPDFSEGALQKEASASEVTPIRAKDLAALVMLTVGYGPLDLGEFKLIFELHDPDEVATWVQTLTQALTRKPHLQLDALIQALDQITKTNPDRPDALNCSLIAEECRSILGDKTFPTKNDVANVVRGLAVTIPNIISIAASGFEVTLSAPAQKIREALAHQLNKIPAEMKVGLAQEV